MRVAIGVDLLQLIGDLRCSRTAQKYQSTSLHSDGGEMTKEEGCDGGYKKGCQDLAGGS